MNKKSKLHRILHAFLIIGVMVFTLTPVHAQEHTEEAIKSQDKPSQICSHNGIRRLAGCL